MTISQPFPLAAPHPETDITIMNDTIIDTAVALSRQSHG